MTFLNSAILVGLAVAAIPIIIHLLNRRKARVIDWGAMRFLTQSLASRSRRIMIEELILLLLRTALLAFLVLAMARPQVVHRYLSRVGSASQDVVILLDGSMSMGVAPPIAAGGARQGSGTSAADVQAPSLASSDIQAPSLASSDIQAPSLATGMTPAFPAPEGSYFETGRKLADAIIQKLAPGDAVAVVLAGGSARCLTGQLTYDFAAARMAVAGAQLTDGVCDVPASLAVAERILRAGRNGNKRVYLISDGRANGWSADSQQAWGALAERIASARQRPTIEAVALAAAPSAGGEGGPLFEPAGSARGGALPNLAIESVRLSRPVVGTDLPVIVTAVVRNTGPAASPAGVPITLRLAGEPVSAAPVASALLGPLGRYDRQAVQLQVHFDSPGCKVLHLAVQASDALANDNHLLCAVEVLDRLPVLLVDGAPSPEPAADECAWLAAAFQPDRLDAAQASPDAEPPIEFLVRPTVVGVELLEHEELDNYYAVVLANVDRLSEGDVDRLTRYVRDGGGLLIAPGDKADVTFYNDVLFAGGRGLCPARLGEAADLAAAKPAAPDSAGQPTPPSEFVSFAPPPQGHPALFRSAEPALWRMTRVFRRFPLQVPPAAAGQPAPIEMMRLTTGEPFALDGALGRGRVVLWGGPADADWSTAPLHNGYVIWVNELMVYLSSARRAKLNVSAGESIRVSRPADRFADPRAAVARLDRPDGGEVVLTGAQIGRQVAFQYDQAADPGVYQMRLESGRPDAAPDLLTFTVQRDPAESMMTSLTQSDRDLLCSWLSELTFRRDGDELLATLAAAQPARELWQYLAAAVLAMLIVEVWLARRITRRRRGQHDRGVAFDAAHVPHTVR